MVVVALPQRVVAAKLERRAGPVSRSRSARFRQERESVAIVSWLALRVRPRDAIVIARGVPTMIMLIYLVFSEGGRRASSAFMTSTVRSADGSPTSIPYFCAFA